MNDNLLAGVLVGATAALAVILITVVLAATNGVIQ